MSQKLLMLSAGLVLALVWVLATAAGLGLKVTPVPSEQSQIADNQENRAACSMNLCSYTLVNYFASFDIGMANVTYFDPAGFCSSPVYPFEITLFSFTLYDDWTVTIWPADVYVVVYDAPDSCSGPGAELCRFEVLASESYFAFPSIGTVQFPEPCCVNGPFYIGLEYVNGIPGAIPSVCYDDSAPADTCVNWFYYAGVWSEWFDIWDPPVPAYPMFWVNGETESDSCIPCEWNLGDDHKMHYPQLPDEAGWDVMATYPIVLADDFECAETGWIKDLHWWGSWRDDMYGEIAFFSLSLHEDIPADVNPDGYSKPGETLWELEVPIDQIDVVGIDPPTMEGWYDPSTGEALPNNHQSYFQYNVCLNEAHWFPQDSGVIYWLNISAVLVEPGPQWGWKSTLDHWNDDAVWAYWGELNWIDLFEPPDYIQSLDLAFVVTGEAPVPDSGACCYPEPTGSGDWLCLYTEESYCLNDLGGVWEGVGVPCQGMEACCLPNGDCVNADVLCCINELGGVPQGPGSQCTIPVACCIGDDCFMYDPLCCDELGGTPSPTGEPTCLGDNNGNDIDDACEEPCDAIIGDADGSGGPTPIDIDDAVYLIAYIFSGGSAPMPYPVASGDADCSCAVDIDDVVYLIAYIFSGGPPSCTCEEWVSVCGALH